MDVPHAPRFLLFGVVLFWIIMGLGYEPHDTEHVEAPTKTKKARVATTDQGAIHLDSFVEDNDISVTQYYGKTAFAASSGGFKSPWHNGIDIEARAGSPIYAPTHGRVIAFGNQDVYCPHKSYGKYILIEDTKTPYSLLYAHIKSTDLEVGDKVGTGDEVARVGITGYTTGPHLHLTVFKTKSVEVVDDESCGPTPRGEDIDPFDYFDKIN